MSERRLAFENLAFQGAPEAPAKTNWVEAALRSNGGSK
jgi:hypothetical protein